MTMSEEQWNYKNIPSNINDENEAELEKKQEEREKTKEKTTEEKQILYCWFILNIILIIK